jgi:ABC-type nitrate/sulfonate/bicarbonate transport system permease component
VVAQLWNDRSLYPTNVWATVREAGIGWLWGNAAAAVLGTVFLLAPPVRRLSQRLVVAVYILPVAALAPLLQILLRGDQPKSALAAQGVFFTTLVGISVGLGAADHSWLEIVRASGGGRVAEFRKVRARAAVPFVFAGLQVAAPAALLGAIIGEYLGGQHGLGVAMIASEQRFFVSRTWGLALVTTAVAAVGFALTGLVGRLLSGWEATGTIQSIQTTPAVRASGRPLVGAATSMAYGLGSVAVVIGAWAGAIRVFHLKAFVAKTPRSTWHFLSQGPAAAANRRVIIHSLSVTGRDAGLGLVLGLVASLAVAVAVASRATLERALMPVAIAVRSIPLVALTPLVALVFGRSLMCVAVIGAMVTFFPGLVNLTLGLRSAPPQALELVNGYGAGWFRTLVTVRLPYALPAFFATLRIAAPTALLGAVLAEWLATGRGMGDLMVRSLSRDEFGMVWASVAVLTVFSVAVYGAATSLESAVLHRFSYSR